MTTLRRRHVAVIEDEFTITSKEMGLAVDVFRGKVTNLTALARLRDWRWSDEDANLFLEMVHAVWAARDK